MSITKKPPTKKEAIEAFISKAPDAQAKTEELTKPRFQKGNKIQITFTLTNELLNQVDKKAKSLGISRTAFINLCLSNATNNSVDA